MEGTERLRRWRKGILHFFITLLVWKPISGQIYYSIPEEMHKGSFVGNIAKDLGLEGKKITESGLRIVPSQGMVQYFALNVNGHLQISERINREEICGKTEKCVLKLQVFIESLLKLHGIDIEITDINDNTPQFVPREWKMKISESSAIRDRFLLPKAQDPDLGINSVQSYQLLGSSHFSLELQEGENGARHAELVLEKPLDREEQPVHDLILVATDGGDPVRSGTAQIQVTVLDANDNAPVFSQPIYEVSIEENTPKGTVICTLRATDLDDGIYGEVKYSYEKITDKDSEMFHLNSTTGEIILLGALDFEAASFYEFEVQAMDGGGLRDRGKVKIRVTDLNDNAPELALTFLTHSVSENSPAGAVIAIVNVRDRDSGVNGEAKCTVPDNLPFQMKKSMDSFFTLVTSKGLDREEVPAYNITISATDEGTPALSSSVLISLQVLDTNDNPPLFTQLSYTSFLLENNPRGASVISLAAQDPDWEENARITYSIIESQMTDSLLPSWLSINSETGVVYALSSFDYEEVHEIHFHVKAQDGGSPSLSSNVSVALFILDQNDNLPEILYPSPPTDGSTGIELAPRSSEPGYLVTKVVAVDKDSGQNAWLSYQLIKATEPGLFTLGLHTGEIRTARFFLEKDALRQTLVVAVKDNGQPSLSTSVTVTVVLADSIPAVLSDLSSISPVADPPSDLTFYLVIAVAFVSCLFFTFLLVVLALKLYRWRSAQMFESGSINFSGVPVSQFVGIDGVRAFLHSYCHEVSLTADSRKSQFNFSKAKCCNTLGSQPLSGEAMDPILPVGDLNSGDQTVVEVS